MAKTNGAKGGTMKTNATKKNAGKAAQGTKKKATKSAAKATTKGTAKAAKKSTAKKVTDTSRIEARLKSKAPVVIETQPELPELVDEPPPSVSVPPIRRLSWGYALLSEITDELMSERCVEAGTKVAIEGELDRLAYVYVVQVADDRSVEILYPPNGGSRRMRPGARMRIPAGSGWIITTKRGKLRTIASTYPLTDEQVGRLA